MLKKSPKFNRSMVLQASSADQIPIARQLNSFPFLIHPLASRDPLARCEPSSCARRGAEISSDLTAAHRFFAVPPNHSRG